MRDSVNFRLALAGLVVCSSGALAGPVTFQFEGTVTQVLDDNGLLGGSVRAGTPFWGEYTFESSTPDSEPGDPTRAFYENPLVSLYGQVGTFPFSWDEVGSSRIYVDNDAPVTGVDSYSVLVSGVEFVAHSVEFGFVLIDGDGAALSSDALPLFPPPLGLFETRHFAVGSQPSGTSVIGRVSTIVPEPATAVLFLLAGTVFLSRHRRNAPISHAKHGAAPSLFAARIMLGVVV